MASESASDQLLTLVELRNGDLAIALPDSQISRLGWKIGDDVVIEETATGFQLLGNSVDLK